MDVASIEKMNSTITFHEVNEVVCDKNISFQIIKLDKSLYLWIGLSNDPNMVDLSLALKTRYDNLPLTTRILGDGTDLVSANLGSKLVKCIDKAVYMSVNVPSDRLLLPEIEKRLFHLVKTKPDMFN